MIEPFLEGSGDSASAMPPSGENSSSESTNNKETKPVVRRRRKKNAEICGVCGDVAKSLHFGGLSCHSCKAFFRRSVHNDAFKGFQCPYEGKCTISIASRKNCQQCRFQKCLRIGMETTWVMTEKEKQEKYKASLEKKKHAHERDEDGKQVERKKVPTPFEPDVSDLPKYLADDEITAIENVVIQYRGAMKSTPFSNHVLEDNGWRSKLDMVEIFSNMVKRFVCFSRMFREFTELPPCDQEILLKGSSMEMCVIRSALGFDPRNNRWPKTDEELYKFCPKVSTDEMKQLISEDLFEMHMRFVNGVQDMRLDEPTMALLLLIALFNAERPGVMAQKNVQAAQERYLHLLRKYMDWRYHPDNSCLLFAKLLTRMADLRELNDLHTEQNLKLAEEDAQQMQQLLYNMTLKCDPNQEVDASATSMSQDFPEPSSDVGNFFNENASALSDSPSHNWPTGVYPSGSQNCAQPFPVITSSLPNTSPPSLNHVSSDAAETGQQSTSLIDLSGTEFDCFQPQQFRSMVEYLTQSNNMDQLLAVKKILGPDLVQEFQQKLCEPEYYSNWVGSGGTTGSMPPNEATIPMREGSNETTCPSFPLDGDFHMPLDNVQLDGLAANVEAAERSGSNSSAYFSVSSEDLVPEFEFMNRDQHFFDNSNCGRENPSTSS